MRQPSKKHQEQKPRSDAPPPINIGDTETSPSVEEAEAKDNGTHYPSHSIPVYKRIFGFFADENNQPKVANTISALMFCATILLACFTIGLFNKTSIQAEKATISANAAVTADSLTKVQIEQATCAAEDALARQDISDKISAIHIQKKDSLDIVTFKLQDSALKTQIKGLRQAQNDFEIENKPLIEVDPMGVDSIGAGMKMTIVVRVFNFGKQPAKIRFLNFKVEISELANFKDYGNYPKPTYAENSIIPGGVNIPIIYKDDFPQTTEDQVKKLRIGSEFVYVIGECDYMNTVTNKESFYRFDYRIGIHPIFNILSIEDSTRNKKF
jgi:hypothetical protein